MKKRIRLFLSVLILSISIALLVWGYAPNPRETRVQPIMPTEMQLPAP
jgi:accessory gene regulator protein AgrB